MERSRTRLHCPSCGEVDVEVATVEVHVNAREDVAVFTFPCPTCAELVVRGCRETIAALLAAGARRYELRATSAPALSHDDLLDFHEWLEQDLPWPPPHEVR